ncbi:hypothetical protein [Streptacidiphilus albus]|uniref:hypothetical protein n=1 Tax=Streptacidiphilus albus TaxID=105425 RepID=UPI00068C49F8|nr:hypothetical protein [Streptacidiphilus albus]
MTSLPRDIRSATSAGAPAAAFRRALRRARSGLLAWAEAEWGPLFRTVRRQLAVHGPAAIPMTLVATAAVLVFQLLQHTAAGAAAVERIGVVQASLPLGLELLRTPLSLFVPAPDLPVWGAAAQVFLVFGIAETAIGRWRTLSVAYLGSLAGTLYARSAVRLGSGHLFGLPFDDAFLRDTGPSAAVVAVAVCVAWRYRAWVTGAAVVVGMAAEQAMLPNMAGAEHLTAILCALAVTGYSRLVERRVGRTADALRSAWSVGPEAEKVRRIARAAV